MIKAITMITEKRKRRQVCEDGEESATQGMPPTTITAPENMNQVKTTIRGYLKYAIITH